MQFWITLWGSKLKEAKLNGFPDLYIEIEQKFLNLFYTKWNIQGSASSMTTGSYTCDHLLHVHEYFVRKFDIS